MTKLKICGIRTKADVAIINEFLPDYIGYVFAPSKRQISISQARCLSALVDKRIKKVGVFVNQPVLFVAETILSGAVDMVQLHGAESREYEAELFELLRSGGIDAPENSCLKAYRIRTEKDIERTNDTLCSMLLLDAFSEKAAGGTGEVFDWTLIKGIEKPFFLAGGLNSENIARAVSSVKPYALDLSSSLETDGKKDREKVNELMRVFSGLK